MASTTLFRYTSPPTEEALQATPEAYRSDDVMDAARATAASNACNSETNACQIVFPPDSKAYPEPPLVGVIYYGGALIDPRAYSPLASTLASRHGLPVVVPIFASDLAFTGSCENSGRLALAQAAFPSVQKWIFSGHSFGGIAASVDVWALYQQQNRSFSLDGAGSAIGGLVLMASHVRQDIGCGPMDFSFSDMPMAFLTASNDLRLNKTITALTLPLLAKDTYMLDITGGNHAMCGSYDDTDRAAILNQTDGIAEISPSLQRESCTLAIYNVAGRTGVSLPMSIDSMAVLSRQAKRAVDSLLAPSALWEATWRDHPTSDATTGCSLGFLIGILLLLSIRRIQTRSQQQQRNQGTSNL